MSNETANALSELRTMHTFDAIEEAIVTALDGADEWATQAESGARPLTTQFGMVVYAR